jgi:hypothetical protein
MSESKIEGFIDAYQKLNRDNLFLLNDIYHPEIQFSDPLHQVNGLDNLTTYFAHLYQNVSSIGFKIDEYDESNNKGFLYWTMTYTHNSLNKGKPISVKGHSRLTFEGPRVIFHQDYLDTNEMIFQHVPVLGKFIKFIKRKASA